MTPKLEQRISEMAFKKYPPTFVGGIDVLAGRREGFFEGAKALVSFEEVKGLYEALEKVVISDKNRDRMDDVDCKTRKMLLLHMSTIASEALAKFREIGGNHGG